LAFHKKKISKRAFLQMKKDVFFLIKEQFLHLDPDLDPAAQIYADPCVSGYGFASAAPLLTVLLTRDPVLFLGSGSE
jgi:hypothetical protein